MSAFGRLRMWLRAVAARSRLDRDMRDEMDAHLAAATARFAARGMAEPEAREAAVREFGHLGSIEQSGREARGAQWITGVAEDLRHAMRYFARTPLSSVTIVLTLALGIGFSSASFSVLEGFMYRPAPGVPDDPALVKIRGLTSAWPYTRKVSWEELTSYASLTRTFSTIVGWATASVVVDDGDSGRGALTSRGVFVTPNYFGTLRTTLVAGRGFEQARFDQVSPPELTAVISHTFAQELNSAEPLAVVGRSVTVNGTPVTIIGVTAPRFNGPIQSGEARTLWLPLSAWETLTGDRRIFNNPDVAMLEALARLQPGVDLDEALPAVRLVASRVPVDAITPDMPGQVRIDGQSAAATANVRFSADVVRLRGRMHRAGPFQDDLHQGIPIFSTIALLILLVCTTTVNSLLVGAGVARRYEIGVRLALGASRWRVVRQLLTEVTILAVVAGLLGMYAFGAVIQVVEVARAGYDVTPDGTTIAFTLLFALITAALCGVSPALHATRTALAEVLKESAVTTTSRSRLQRSFVVAQIAIAMPLLVSLGAALAFLTQGLRQSPHVALRERLIVLNIDTQSGSNATGPDPVPRIMERLSALTGVEAVLPRGTARVIDVSPADRNAADSFAQIEVDLMHVAPGFFEAVNAPVFLGRDFVATDSALEVPPVILSDSLAQRLFPAGALGKRLRTMWQDERPVEMEVIGVARAGFGAGFLTFESDAPLAFAPLRGARSSVILIRTSAPAEPLLPRVRDVIATEAPGFPVSRLTTMAAFDFHRREELKRIGGAGLGSGAIALLMAAIGLYAMLHVAVGQRRREIGVRLAIGARRDQVVRLFFARGLKTALLGVLIGLPFSIIALRWINSELLMPTLYVAGVALAIMAALVLVAAFASWLPARRAATVDPSLVLRSE